MQPVYTDENHLTVLWLGPADVMFSYSQRGKAISAHFAADKSGIRHLRMAINDFCEWAFFHYPWARMILAQIKKPSVERLVQKCGFSFVTEHEDIRVYMRGRK